jgi:hypothetical protein
VARVPDLQFSLQSHWPPLAWLARLDASSNTVSVLHGAAVEIADDWFGEAVWDGEYAAGGIDRTDIVAGSAGRRRGSTLTFVSSGSTVDRLQTFTRGHTAWVSNSLACLLAAVGAHVDPTYRRYYDDAATIIRGLNRYKRSLSTSLGPVDLVYFDNLTWDGTSLNREPKPVPPRDFSTFEKYRTFLDESLAAVAANSADSARRFPLRLLGTLSSGYDSTTVSVLAKAHGLTEVLTVDRARGGDEDSGATVAAMLGLRAHRISRDAWRNADRPEVPFIASYSSAEDLPFKAAEELLRGRVLLTGYHGDKVWGRSSPDHPIDLSDQIVRGDPSGLALTEYRLWVPFINCAVPFWGARQIGDIHALSCSEEMRPWDVSGPYSRPICRRIGEEAGLPREAFGTRKRAVTVNPFAGNRELLTPGALPDYLEWIRQNRTAWLRRGKLPPVASSRVHSWVNRCYVRWTDFISPLRTKRFVWRFVNAKYHPRYLASYLFPWALDRAMQVYRGGAPVSRYLTEPTAAAENKRNPEVAADRTPHRS